MENQHRIENNEGDTLNDGPRIFELSLHQFFFFYDNRCREAYRNSDNFHQNISFEERSCEFDLNSHIYLREIAIRGLDDNTELALQMKFCFDFVGFNGRDPWTFDYDYAHCMIFESLKEKVHRACFRYKVLSDFQQPIDTAPWSEWIFYNIPNDAVVSDELYTFTYLFTPIRDQFFNLIVRFARVHLLGMDISPLLWNAIGRLTDVAGHVINRKRTNQYTCSNDI